MLFKENFGINKESNSIINLTMLQKDYNIYNGRTFINVKITSLMFGYYLGEFIFTRKIGKIHNVQKKKGGKGIKKS